MLLGSYLVNDFNRINKTEILKKVRDSTRFSFSFITLLIGSSIVCTLGLLLNSTAVVIGGMIISPLMWPLMQTSIGVSYGRTTYIRRALIVLVVATLIALVTSVLITFVSPIKIVNSEILSRTNPTLIDIVIALVAGGVAALAITQPKISESLAGVAIATSLMPPLCVSGIGMALMLTKVFWGGLLLYFTNIVSIIFVSVIVFIWLGLKTREEDGFQKRALGLTAFILLIIAIPLFILLRQVSFDSIAFSRAENSLERELADISEGIFISDLDVVVQDESSVVVEAEILVPDDVQISYEDRQNIQAALVQELNAQVDLKLRLQNTVSILSQSDIENNQKKDRITGAFISSLSELKPNLKIDRVDVSKDKTGVWNITGVLIGDPSVRFVFSDKEKLESLIAERSGESVLLDLDIISRVRIQSDPDELEAQIRNSVDAYFSELATNVSITTIDVDIEYLESSSTAVKVNLIGTVPSGEIINSDDLNFLQDNLQNEYQVPFDISLRLTRTDTFEIFSDTSLEDNSLEGNSNVEGAYTEIDLLDENTQIISTTKTIESSTTSGSIVPTLNLEEGFNGT